MYNFRFRCVYDTRIITRDVRPIYCRHNSCHVTLVDLMPALIDRPTALNNNSRRLSADIDVE